MEEENNKKTPKEHLLTIAEIIDTFRIIPRLFLVLYGILVYNLYHWFTNIETFVQQKCDAALLRVLLDHGEKLDFAQQLACTVGEVTGGPTTVQGAFVTAIVGLAVGVFGFYTSTGKKWGDSKDNSSNGPH